MTTKQNPETQPSSHLLNLPPELRLKIYTPLLTPQTTPLTITPLFIRAHYKTLFMSQHHKSLCTSLLLVCRQITKECLPILYGIPTWRASCRLEQLASQIGVENFGRIRKMEVDADDLGVVLAALRKEQIERQSQTENEGTTMTGLAKAPSTYLRFSNLEQLSVEGWQKAALTSRGSKASRVEGRGLCFMASGLIAVAPSLNVLVQVGDGNGIGGSDARDLSMGRVKWKFLRSVRDIKENEHIVDLDEMIVVFDALIEMDEVGEVDEKVLGPGMWRGGKFRLYPYLETD